MPAISSPRATDQRLVMYRFSKSRSHSVGSGTKKNKRKAEFQDSGIVTVNTGSLSEARGKSTWNSVNDLTGVIDRQDREKRHPGEDMASTKGFARLDVVSLCVRLLSVLPSIYIFMKEKRR